MKKLLIIGLLMSASVSFAQDTNIENVTKLLRTFVPILKVGQFIQDEKGCIYNVVKKGKEISLQSSVTTTKGEIVCEEPLPEGRGF